jgi:sterol desaturase/sphingolipid hydroxylase (fatty acid hydroxylase superfamily)
MFLLRATKDSPPMFENKFIDLFSRTHFLTVPILYVPATAILVAYSIVVKDVHWLATIGLVAGGFAWWTFVEYWLHRTLFHWTPKAKWGERFHFFLHGVNHSWPDDRYRLVMPPTVSLTLFWVFLAMNWLLFDRYGFAFHAGMTVGYMTYDLTHYYTHHGRAKAGRMRRLRQHHMHHHFRKGHTGKFGVSTTVWDRVFGTFEMKREGAEKAEKATDAAA